MPAHSPSISSLVVSMIISIGGVRFSGHSPNDSLAGAGPLHNRVSAVPTLGGTKKHPLLAVWAHDLGKLSGPPPSPWAPTSGRHSFGNRAPAHSRTDCRGSSAPSRGEGD